jgi:Uma2 family endonuclease
MTALLEAAEGQIQTISDLLDRLGGISPTRVLLRPPPGTATEADVLTVHDKTGRLCELVEGTLVEKAMGLRESLLAVAISGELRAFVRPRNLGILSGADGPLGLAIGLVRMPDVAYLSWDRLPGRRVPEEPIPHIGPDLAVEVLSKSNTRAEMRRKLAEYFEAGTRLAWLIDPESRTVAVYTSPQHAITLNDSQSLDGGSVLPGFVLPLRQLFAELDMHGESKAD